MQAINDIEISRSIVNSYLQDFSDYLTSDVVIAGGGPAGLIAAHDLAKGGLKTLLLESNLAIGGGMWGGGMGFNKIVLQEESLAIAEDVGISVVKGEKGCYVADAVQSVCALGKAAVDQGARILNLIEVEDVYLKEDVVTGLVINWSPISKNRLHVDPLTLASRAIIDATGHPANIVRVLQRKNQVSLNTEDGKIVEERSMWAEQGEEAVLAHTAEVFEGLFVTGMAANAVYGKHRMGPIFGGMLLSGRKVARLVAEKLHQDRQ